MENKGINRLFLSIILIHVVMSVVLVFTQDVYTLGIIENFLYSQSMILIPGLIYLLIYWKKRKKFHIVESEEQDEEHTQGAKETICGRLGFRKMKVSTFFMVILLTFTLMPLATVINAISMLFVDNTMLALSPEILEQPYPIVLFMVAIFAPFCEELVYRGIIFGGYRRQSSVLKAVLLSGFLFGVMHLNFNQMAYAIVLGIAFALVVEATGSLWSSMVCHFIFNAQSITMLYLYKWFMPDLLESQLQMQPAKEELYLIISVYMVIAAISTAIAYCILLWLSKNEGRDKGFKQILAKRKGGKLCSVSLVLALIVAFALMIMSVIMTL